MSQWTIIIFGISGDLAKRQIIPALYELFRTSPEKNRYTIIGTAREALTIDELLAQARPFIEQYTDATMQEFKKQCRYYQVDVTKHEQFTQFAHTIMPLLSPHRIAYLAVPANYFYSITQQLIATGIIQAGNQQHRIAYEKPFGWDAASAEKINQEIAQLVDEQQLYRIDHYLTKGLVSNILLLRFSNTIFEPLWNKNYIAQVEIIIDETLGIEERGAYYDRYGALKDVVQNHMLQMLALIAMEQPTTSDHHAVQAEKATILKHVAVQQCVLGQYAGYQQAPSVQPNSTTDTFAACVLTIDQPRWHGVPFYLRTGKCLQKKVTEIKITFKQQQCFLAAARNCLPNVLTIALAPEEGFRLRLNTKKPNSATDITTVTLDFCYSCLYGPETAQAYVTLFQSIMMGDHTITVSPPEIAAQWAIIEQIQSLHPPLIAYEPGSEGPAAALQLLHKERE